MGKAGALLGFDVVLYVNEQADLLTGYFRLSGRTGSSGNPGSNSFLRIINPQCFQAGKPFLIGRPAGDILAPLDFVSLCLQPLDKFLKSGYLGDKPVNGSFQFCLIVGSCFRGSMLNVALSFILSWNYDGQSVFLAQSVAGAADEMITPLVGVVFPIIHKADRIKNDVVMDMSFVYVGG